MKKVLIIDDDLDVLEAMGSFLKSKGYHIHTHASGYHVPDIVKGYNPDIILLDVELSEVIGTDVCKELKKKFNIPIIIMSGHRYKSIHECNADAYISKPFNLIGLIDKINFHLNTPIAMGKKAQKILVVDDEVEILHVVEDILKIKGYDVIKHSNGLNVHEIISIFKPDLILLDVQISGIKGTDICTNIKKISAIPVILFSAHADLQKTYQECNADAFIAKPFDIEHLLNEISKHLNSEDVPKVFKLKRNKGNFGKDSDSEAENIITDKTITNTDLGVLK